MSRCAAARPFPYGCVSGAAPRLFCLHDGAHATATLAAARSALEHVTSTVFQRHDALIPAPSRLAGRYSRANGFLQV
jgi:hypothetical protein